VFWDQGAKKLKMTTDITMPDETTVSLLDQYQTWEKNR
jgi:hypothetical protein